MEYVYVALDIRTLMKDRHFKKINVKGKESPLFKEVVNKFIFNNKDPNFKTTREDVLQNLKELG